MIGDWGLVRMREDNPAFFVEKPLKSSKQSAEIEKGGKWEKDVSGRITVYVSRFTFHASHSADFLSSCSMELL